MEKTEFFSEENITTFMNLFKGRQDAFGLETSNGPITKREPLTDAHYLNHLTGNERLGILPIMPDNKVFWSVIDIDSDDKSVVERVYAICILNDLFVYLERSKSKGYHIWIFFDGPISAHSARLVLNQILREADAKGIEIFPKQDLIRESNGLGNFVYLPWNGESVKDGKTLFLDAQFNPYEDQLEHLKKIHFTKRETIEFLAQKNISIQPKMMSAQIENESLGSLDVQKFLIHNNINSKVKEDGDRTFYLLPRCLFFDQHTTKDNTGDSSIIQGSDGKLGYQCFHNHCSNKTWHDARRKISGDAPILQFCRGYVPPPVSLTHKRGEGRSITQIFSEPEESPQHIAKPIFSRGDKGFIVSSYKIGKTLFLIQLTLCLAMAIPFLGFEIPSAVKVLYIRFELKNYRFRKHLTAMLAGLGGLQNIKNEPIFELVRGFNIIDKKDFEWLMGMIQKYQPGVLILDPLYKLTSFDLKDTANAMPLIRKFDSIIEAYPDLLVIMAHHLRKQTSEQGHTWDSAYGPMFFFADMDFQIRITAKHEKNPDFTFEHISNDVPIDSFMFKRNPDTLLYYVSNPEADHLEEILDYILQHKPTKTALKEWMVSALGVSTRQGQKSIERLIVDKKIAYSGKNTRGHLVVPEEEIGLIHNSDTVSNNCV